MKKNKKNNKTKSNLKIIPLGGLGYIGKNMTLFEYDDEMIIVDCGIRFPSDDMPGIDYIIPDFKYLKANRTKIKGLIITHGHEDHIGAVPFLLQELNIPIYATRLTIGLIKKRLEERPPKDEPRFIEVKPRQKSEIGQEFKVEFINVNHSILDGVGLAIKTPVGTIIHTGDFKIDYSPMNEPVIDLLRFADYGQEGVLLMMADSTNAEKEGFTKSENVVIPKLVELFSNARGRVICATFASSISRLQQIFDVAQRYNRKVAVSGKTMVNNIEIAASLGYLKFKEDLLVDITEVNQYPDKKLVIICTGSQGEPMSALSRMSNASHRHIAVKPGDTVIITASIIPGNEKGVINVINSLMKQGAKVYYEHEEDIHVSGHASAEELKLMLNLVKPKYYLPVHGEFKHLKANAEIAASLGMKQNSIMIADNGDVIELNSNRFQKVKRINLNEIFVDGDLQGDLKSFLIRDRRSMAQDGILVVSIILSSGQLTASPIIISKGFALSSNTNIVQLEKFVQRIVDRALMKGAKPSDLRSEVKKSLKGHLYKTTRRSPLISILIQEI